MAPGLLVGLAALLAGRLAEASCAGPSGQVLWTYPANGAVDVPTNTRLLVTEDSAGRPSINGTLLAPDQDGTFDLGELAPNTTYEVVWRPMRVGSTAQSISFTTGGGPSLDAAPPVQEPLAVTRAGNVSSCRLAPRGCFDTGRNAVAFWPKTAPVAWLVESQDCRGDIQRMIWPGECGAPTIETLDARVCARLRATDGVHVSEETETICSFPELPDGVSVPSDSACVGFEFPPPGALTLTSKEGVTCSSDDPAHCGAASSDMTPSSGGCALALRGGADGGLFGVALAAGLAQLRRSRRRVFGGR